jgi:hypothetical protein
MRKELGEKSDELLKRIEDLEESTKAKDDTQQTEINDLKLLADNQIALSEKMEKEI